MGRVEVGSALLGLVVLHLVLRALRTSSKRNKKIAPKHERVVILGASTDDGLGAAFLQQYLERGTRQVVIVGRRLGALEEVRAKVLERTAGKRAESAEVHVFAADCTKSSDVIALRDFVQTTLHGFDTLQVVFGVTSIMPVLGLANVDPKGVNANGEASTRVDPTVDGLDAIANTVQHSCDGNVKGTAIVLGALIPVLQTTSIDPVVVGTGSVAGLIPAPTRAVYCATKAAQHFLLESVALECDSQAGTPVPGTDKRRALVRFLLIAPGPIKNSFVKTYSVDSTTGPRDNRDKALDVNDVVRATLQRVDANGTGIMVLPPAAFVAAMLSKFNLTYVLALLTQPRRDCEGGTQAVSLLVYLHGILSNDMTVVARRPVSTQLAVLSVSHGVSQQWPAAGG